MSQIFSDDHTTRFDRLETLLTQILARLQKNPSGTNHNESGLFCRTCGEAFVCAVASSLCREVTPEEAVYG